MIPSSAIGSFVIGRSPIGAFVPPPPPVPFPPPGPTTVTKVIPAYLYQEYNDDDDLQGFFAAQNALAQDIVGWFATIGLPVYTGEQVSNLLLDWVIAGLYGIEGRPALPSGTNQDVGPLNTWALNTLALNAYEIIGNQNFYATTDDIFRRILTWHFYKGDGKVFTIRWLKRRIMRFLTGVDGTAGETDETYPISVSFGAGNQVNIGVANGTRTITTSALLNTFALNTVALNELDSTFVPEPPFPLAPILKAGIDSGVLELPFQFTYVVTITT